MRRVITLAVFALLAALAPTLGVDVSASGTATAAPDATVTTGTTPLRAAQTLRQNGRVVHVVDGDTVDVRLSKSRRVTRVRMVGIDTPEVYGTVECGGPEASNWLKKHLPVNTKVRLVSDPTQDRTDDYGRALRYLIRAKAAHRGIWGNC